MPKSGPLVGTRAPDFLLPCTRVPGSDRDRVCLADYQDRWLVLVFYPRDFTLVCPTELTALSARLDEFHRCEAEVLAVSTDSVATHERWLVTPRSQGGLGGLRFPLAGDEQGQACQAYGVYLPRQHVALRGLFIIDPNGVVQYQVVHNLSVGRRSDEVLRVLEALQTGGLCPEGWTQEQAVIDPVKTLGPGSVLGQYVIDAQLGAGSFGTVFRARDQTLQRTVAIKVLRPAAGGAHDAVLREARAAAALVHANVCTLFAVDGSEGVSMLVMEYLDGRPLARLLEAGPLAPAEAAALGRQVAQGMAAAHAHGIVHGDLKPANVLVTHDGIAKVMDFGLARRVPKADAEATADWQPEAVASATGLSGTPGYMAPEQVRGEPATAASDVFALGLVLYEMATGRRAVAGGNLLEVLRRVEQVDPQRYAAEVPEPFAAVLRQALVNDPGRRTITMAAIAEILGPRAA
jgi:eukaryotic-like serine/threonine-protein kinase